MYTNIMLLVRFSKIAIEVILDIVIGDSFLYS